MSRYTSKSSNPFEEEDDFVYVPSENSHRSPFEDRRQKMSRLVDESEDRQLESTQRAIASLYDSEAMGNATAEELLRQREVIHNIESKTDEINSTLTTSQRHINNIKSVFGGIKNWWGGKKDAAAQESQARTNTLDSIVKKSQESGAGNVSRSSSGGGWKPVAGFGEGPIFESDLDARFMAQSAPGPSRAAGSASRQFVQPITGSAREEELDKNLGLMSDGLGRLKDLARGLGDEIESQNADLDRINPKVNRANDLLENQNRQMNRILKR